MKRTIATIALAIAMTAQADVLVPANKPVTDTEWNTFLTALAQVESNGRTNLKVLDVNGRYSYGCLQIQSPYLQDSGTGYSLENLFDKAVSFEVAKRYLTRYGRSYEKRTGKPATYEVLARIHNGGPRGAERSATQNYWKKVQAELAKNP